LSISDVSLKIRINPKYIEAIESGEYRKIPGIVYARNFVRLYARFLNVREATALGLFEEEYRIADTSVSASKPTPNPRVHPLLTPRGIRRSIILLLSAAVLVYLGLEIRNITAAPALTIASPNDQTTTDQRTIELRGMTEPETTVTANGRTIPVDREGNFRETLDLQDGLNTIVIRSVKKRGGATTVVRNILVSQSDSNR